MKLSDVLIKPILSEKANKQTEKMNRYSFVVNKKANKLEIKKAIESFYGVTVDNVNTIHFKFCSPLSPPSGAEGRLILRCRTDQLFRLLLR